MDTMYKLVSRETQQTVYIGNRDQCAEWTSNPENTKKHRPRLEISDIDEVVTCIKMWKDKTARDEGLNNCINYLIACTFKLQSLQSQITAITKDFYQ